MWWSKRKQNIVVVSLKVKEKPVVTCITYISLCKKMFENLKRTKKGWELFLKGLMIIGNKKMFSISFFFFHTYKNTFYVYKCYSSALLSPLSSFFMGFINLSLSSLGFIESHQLHRKKEETITISLTCNCICITVYNQPTTTINMLNANAGVCVWNNWNLKGRENKPV